MGILYDRSITWLVVFSVALQLAAIPVLFLVKKRSFVTENWPNTRQSYHFRFSIFDFRLTMTDCIMVWGLPAVVLFDETGIN
ncbi:hypothetical protein QUA20_23805 [Microcoleus sp. Pol7_A1]|uniref:hypothetical protein n=1 Tax=Microcoleus sp. Pol7_A1 TaxID=2818893 RepID=UPI002FD40DF8